MIIFINFVKINSYLCAEGVLSENLFVTDSVEYLENILFQIHLQRQYSAAVELDLFTERRKEIMNEVSESSDESGALDDKRSKKQQKALIKVVIMNLIE